MTIDEITSQATDEIHLVTLYRQKHDWNLCHLRASAGSSRNVHKQRVLRRLWNRTEPRTHYGLIYSHIHNHAKCILSHFVVIQLVCFLSGYVYRDRFSFLLR